MEDTQGPTGVLGQEECFSGRENVLRLSGNDSHDAFQILHVGSVSSSSNSVQLSNSKVSTGAFRQKTFLGI